MKLGTKERYAVMAMTDIAMNSDKGNQGEVVAISLNDISKRNNLPINYLEQIFVRLRRAGLVQSVRGNSGGYALAKDSSIISIKSIMDAIDKGVKTTGCSTNILDSGNKEVKISCRGDHSASCINHHFWQNLENQINDYLENTTVADLVSGAKKEDIINGDSGDINKISVTPQKINGAL